MYVVFMLNRRVIFVNSAAENTNSCGSILSIFNPDKKTLKEKVKLLNKNYDDWFFVVTKWEFKEKYSTLGKTYGRKEIPNTIKMIMGENSQTTNPQTKEIIKIEAKNLP